MKNKSTVMAIIVVVVLIVGYVWWQNSQSTPTNTDVNANINVNTDTDDKTQDTVEVKEFTMTSFYELVDNQPKPQFSIKEITVKKGDKVRIKVTNTKGGHDFKLDEYNIFRPTPLNEEVIIEFTADKIGDFVYYCNQPNHRSLGHWGTLRVTE